jgi:hypothetical protein
MKTDPLNRRKFFSNTSCGGVCIHLSPSLNVPMPNPMRNEAAHPALHKKKYSKFFNFATYLARGAIIEDTCTQYFSRC